MTTDALCPICADGEPQPVICGRCTDRIRRHLDTVGRLRHELDPTPGRTGSNGRAPGKPGSRPPANLTVIAMSDIRSRMRITDCGHAPGETCDNPRCGEHDPDDVANIDADLLTEARWVIEERQLHPPLRDAFDSIRVLNIHFDWIVRHPRADEFAAVIEGCARGLRGVLNLYPRSIGRCPAADPRNPERTCGGPLQWIDGTLQIQCARCRDIWTEQDLTHIARVVDVWIPISDASELLGVTVRTLNRWAEAGHIRRDHGRVLYAEASEYVRRHARDSGA